MLLNIHSHKCDNKQKLQDGFKYVFSNVKNGSRNKM